MNSGKEENEFGFFFFWFLNKSENKHELHIYNVVCISRHVSNIIIIIDVGILVCVCFVPLSSPVLCVMMANIYENVCVCVTTGKNEEKR